MATRETHLEPSGGTSGSVLNAQERVARATTVAGVTGGLAMIACCIVPLALFFLGVSGTWIGTLTALGAYKTWIGSATVGVLAAGLFLAYRRPRACAPGTACATAKPRRLMRGLLWTATAFSLASFAFPYVAPFLLRG